jgi:hypothetical protein
MTYDWSVRKRNKGEDPKQEKRIKEKNMKMTSVIGKRNNIRTGAKARV